MDASEYPILACGSVLSDRDATLILLLLGLWLAGFILYLVNFVMILIRPGLGPKCIHGGVFVVYTFLAGSLYSGTAGGFEYPKDPETRAQVIQILAFLIPALVIAHFIFLVVERKMRANRKQRVEYLPPRRQPASELSRGELSKPPSVAPGNTADERLGPFVKNRRLQRTKNNWR